jgi:HEAT repeat protein
MNIANFIEKLRGASGQGRGDVIRQFGNSVEFDAKSVPVLNKLLSAGDKLLRYWVLHRLENEESVSGDLTSGCIANLTYSDQGVRERARKVLVKIGLPILEEMNPLLQSEDKTIRASAGIVLSQVERRKSVELLKAVQLAQHSPELKEAADEQIDRILTELVSELGNSDGLNRMAAGELIMAIGNDSIPKLREALNNESDEVKSQSAFVLGNMGPKANAAVSDLMRVFRNPNGLVRKAAADALVGIGSDSLPFLLGALSDEDPQIRKSAVYALGNMGSKAQSALDKLNLLLDDDSTMVKDMASRAIRKIQEDVHGIT